MKLTQSLVAIAALSTLSFAGGDINPITVFEQEPVFVPVEAVPVPVPLPEPVFVPAPVPTPKAVVVAPPAVVAPIVAAAAPLGLYLAGGITGLGVRQNDRVNLLKEVNTQDRQIGYTGRIGYDFMDYLGAELRGTVGLAKIDNPRRFKQGGAYLKPNYDITDEMNVYGLLGVSKTNHAGTAPASTGFSYGLGANYGVTDEISIFTDLVNYMKKSNTPSEWGLTLGAAYQF